MMALSPQERTWVQLQENFRRKRQAHTGSRQLDQQGRHYGRYKKAPTVPLPRIVDSPSDAPLRGSHYPVIPPVANDRFYNDDTFSLQSYNSDVGQLEDFDDSHVYSPPQLQSPTFSYSETARGRHRKPQVHRDPWNSSTRVRGEPRPFMDHTSHLMARHQDTNVDGSIHRRRGAGRGPRVGGFQGRHVWKDLTKEEPAEDESATVVQRHFRGYRTRKGLRLLHHLQNPSFAVSFMHHFLKDALQNDLILDIACEVLVEERQQVVQAGHAQVNRLAISNTPSHDSRHWVEALQRPDIPRQVAAGLMNDVIQEESRVVVLHGVNELLQDYFDTKAVADATRIIVTEVLMEMIPGSLEECQEELAMETVVDDIIDGEMLVLVGGFLQEALMRRGLPLDSTEEEVEMQEVARIAESSLLDAILLDHLLSSVIVNGQKWSYAQPADWFLDDQLLEILLGQYVGVLHNRRATEECVPLKRLHEKVVTDVALDAIFGELMDQLEEDLQDLDEYERG
ncbi:uncharacterized protein LOC110980621 [Acanthaster planci]|uniref:Uncharacterized protein LOC110980621 n=1 Tax=Acanthaster planci TaxID=133434 RepID=A0A8B7YKL3_ACAPL|nr:uncharacterized protein LOC110980621 [Acanthaster planci]